MDKFRKIITYVFLILLLSILYYYNFFFFLENKAYDFLFVSRYILNSSSSNDIYYLNTCDNKLSNKESFKMKTEESSVTLITIDDKTLEELEGWPLPRDYYAKAVEILEKEGVKALGFDIFFKNSTEHEKDKKFAKALSKYSNIVLAAVINNDQEFDQEETRQNYSLKKPYHCLEEEVKLGHINFRPDSDGIIRKLPLKFEINGQIIEALSAALARAGGMKINYGQEDNLLINYRGPDKTLPRISFLDLLKGNYHQELLRNKYVLVGVSSSTIRDYLMTPFSDYGYMLGVEIHGQVLETIINDNAIKKIHFPWKLILLVFLSFIFLYVFHYYSPQKGRNILFLSIVLLPIISYICFCYYNIFIDFITISIIIFITFAVSLFYWFLFSRDENKRLIEIFEKYISEDLLQKVLKSKDMIELGGQKVELTVFFVDIRKFTAYAEDKKPEQLVSELNMLFADLNKAIFDNQGTLDKYLGDGLMAFFGAPVFYENHADRAVEAARAMLKIDTPFELGIGINTGTAVVGNIGSEKRMEYTVIGGCVNRAARFVERADSGEIMIGEYTYESLAKSNKDLKWIKNKENINGYTREIITYSLCKQEGEKIK